MSAELQVSVASPFDALRRTDEAGEHWTGRDLMHPLGYDSWRRFDDAIERAKAACANSGNDVTSNFAGSVKNPAGVGRPAEDVRLTRFGAYLVAMNGDPRKPEIAAAQSYFAVKTREAEIAAAPAHAPLSFEDRMRILQMATGLVDPSWLEAKTRHTIARALGEQPEIDPATRPLTVGEYLQDRGLSGAALRSASTKFGRRLKALYRDSRGADPGQVERFVDNALRSVASYTEADRALFDAVWAESYATKAVAA